MIRIEFFKALDSLCPKNPEDSIQEKILIDNWMDRKGLKPDDLDDLIIGIQENHAYKTYPRLPVVIEIWEKINKKEKPKFFDEAHSLRETIRKIKEGWYNKYSTFDIIGILQKIRFDGVRNVKDIDRLFYATFEPLVTEYLNMKEQGMPEGIIFEKLGYIKDCLRDGKPYQSNMKQNFDPIPETEDREGKIKKYKQISKEVV